MLITRIWRTQPGRFFCISRRRGDIWHDKFFTRDEFADVEEYIADHNEDYDVYFCPHSFSSRSRRSEHYVESRLLWADLDQVNPTTLDLRPTCAWETSPRKFAAVWMLDGEPTRGLRRAFNKAIGTDAGWHITKVLRAPGTRNFKYGSAPCGRILWEHGPTYSLDRIARKYPVSEEQDPHTDTPIDIRGLDWREILQRYGLRHLTSYVIYEVPGPVEGRRGKRSDVVWRLIMDLKEKGASPSEAAAVAWASKAFKSKWGDNMDRLRKQVGKAFSE